MMPTFLSKTFFHFRVVWYRWEQVQGANWLVWSVQGKVINSLIPLIPPKHFISLHLLFSIHYWHLSVLKYIYLTWFVPLYLPSWNFYYEDFLILQSLWSNYFSGRCSLIVPSCPCCVYKVASRTAYQCWSSSWTSKYENGALASCLNEKGVSNWKCFWLRK